MGFLTTSLLLSGAALAVVALEKTEFTATNGPDKTKRSTPDVTSAFTSLTNSPISGFTPPSLSSLQGVNNAFTGFAQGSQSSGSGVTAEKTKRSTPDVTSAFTSLTNSPISGFTPPSLSSLQGVNNAFTGFSQGSQSSGAGVTDSLQGVNNAFTGFAQGSQSSGAGVTAEKTKRSTPDVTSAFTSLTNSPISGFTPPSLSSLQGVNNAFTGFSQGSQSSGAGVTDSLQGVNNAFTGFAQGSQSSGSGVTAEKTKRSTPDVTSAFTSLTNSPISGFTPPSLSSLQGVNNAFTGFSQGSQSSGAGVTDSLQGVNNAFTGFAQGSQSSGSGVTAEKTKRSTPDVTSAFTSLTNSPISGFTPPSLSSLQGVNNAFTGFSQGSQSSGAGVTDSLQGVNNAFTGFAQGSQSSGSGVTAEKTKRSTPDVTSAFTSLTNSPISGFTPPSLSSLQGVNNAFTGFAQGSQSSGSGVTAEKTKRSTPDFTSAFTSLTNSPISGFTPPSLSSLQGVNNAFTGFAQGAESSGAGVTAEKTKRSTPDLTSAFTSLTNSPISGFTPPSLSSLQGVNNAFTGFAQGAESSGAGVTAEKTKRSTPDLTSAFTPLTNSPISGFTPPSLSSLQGVNNAFTGFAQGAESSGAGVTAEKTKRSTPDLTSAFTPLTNSPISGFTPPSLSSLQGVNNAFTGFAQGAESSGAGVTAEKTKRSTPDLTSAFTPLTNSPISGFTPPSLSSLQGVNNAFTGFAQGAESSGAGVTAEKTKRSTPDLTSAFTPLTNSPISGFTPPSLSSLQGVNNAFTGFAQGAESSGAGVTAEKTRRSTPDLTSAFTSLTNSPISGFTPPSLSSLQGVNNAFTGFAQGAESSGAGVTAEKTKRSTPDLTSAFTPLTNSPISGFTPPSLSSLQGVNNAFTGFAQGAESSGAGVTAEKTKRSTPDLTSAFTSLTNSPISGFTPPSLSSLQGVNNAFTGFAQGAESSGAGVTAEKTKRSTPDLTSAFTPLTNSPISGFTPPSLSSLQGVNNAFTGFAQGAESSGAGVTAEKTKRSTPDLTSAFTPLTNSPISGFTPPSLSSLQGVNNAFTGFAQGAESSGAGVTAEKTKRSTPDLTSAFTPLTNSPISGFTPPSLSSLQGVNNAFTGFAQGAESSGAGVTAEKTRRSTPDLTSAFTSLTNSPISGFTPPSLSSLQGVNNAFTGFAQGSESSGAGVTAEKTKRSSSDSSSSWSDKFKRLFSGGESL